MHVISRKKIREFCMQHRQAEGPLDHWYRVVRRARWSRFAELRADFGAADFVAPFVVFNVAGSKYRLIAEVVFERGKVFIRHILTHAEYDEKSWRR